ncbi:hypothetical protein ACX80D_02675 [Arthrobacter sp. Sr24]
MTANHPAHGPFRRSIAVKLFLRRTGAFLLVAATVQVIFFGLLVAGQSVPDDAVAHNLSVAIKSGNYGPDGLNDRMGGTSDTFTECIVAATGLGHPGENVVIRAAYMPRLGSCAGGKEPILELAAGKALPDGIVSGYSKYWAGYTAVTRPVIALFGLTGMRIVAGAMLLFSAILAVVVLGRRTGMWAAAGLLLPLGLASNIMSTPSTSFSQAFSISVMFFGVALTAWGAAKSTKRTIFSVGLAGALFCFVDLLTAPAIPWAFCTVVAAGLTYAKHRTLRPTLLAGIIAASVWILAFAGTWFSRWIFAALFLGVRTTYKSIVSNIEFRTGGEHAAVKHTLFAPTEANWTYWITHVSTSGFITVAVGIVIVLALAMTWGKHGLRTVAAWPVLILSAVVVIVWFEVLNNHSQIHAFFTYRGLPAMLGVLLFSALTLWQLPRVGKKNSIPKGEVLGLRASPSPTVQGMQQEQAESRNFIHREEPTA